MTDTHAHDPAAAYSATIAGAATIEDAVYIAVGAASGCWSNLRGAGVFQDRDARAVAEALNERIQRGLQIVDEPGVPGGRITVDEFERRRALLPADPGPIAEAGPCGRCDGCGQIANDDDGSPWTAWTELPAASQTAIRMGWVAPIDCPSCGGTGQAAA